MCKVNVWDNILDTLNVKIGGEIRKQLSSQKNGFTYFYLLVYQLYFKSKYEIGLSEFIMVFWVDKNLIYWFKS